MKNELTPEQQPLSEDADGVAEDFPDAERIREEAGLGSYGGHGALPGSSRMPDEFWELVEDVSLLKARVGATSRTNIALMVGHIVFDAVVIAALAYALLWRSV